MPVRVFIMPNSLDEALATSQGAPNAPDGLPSKERTSNTTDSDPQPSKLPSESQVMEPKAGITYAYQDKLPKLPIPDLESTCKRYLEALKPLQSTREHECTIAAVQEFLKKDGPQLQDRLKKYATGRSSYIEQFCKLSFVSLYRRHCILMALMEHALNGSTRV